MKTVKITGIAIIILISIIVLIGFFLPRRVTVERKISINSTKEIAFEQINNLKNWEKWSPWYSIDTSTVYTYSEPSFGKGANYKWISENKNVSKGNLIILESFEFDSITFDLDFEIQGGAEGCFMFRQLSDSLEITWTMTTDASFNPLHHFFNLFMNKILGADMQLGLQNIKTLCESIPKIEPTIIEEFQFEGCRYIGIMDSCNITEFATKLETNYDELKTYMQKNKLVFISSPLCITYSYTNEKTIFEAAIPVSNDAKIKDEKRIKVKQLPASKVLLAHYYGAYDQIFNAYIQIENLILETERTAGSFSWEEYITAPANEPDTAKWYTKIYYTVE